MADNIKQTILCVDDEVDVANSLYDTFMDTYNVKTANSGEEALKIFKEEDIALIISDQRMPEMEGTELLTKIDELKPICKKILLTGYADINAAIDAINKGSVDKYFSKPWDDDELTNAVDDLLSEYSMDLFFEKAIDDTKKMKQELTELKGSSGIIKNFMDKYFLGVCLFDNDSKIGYINPKGLEILQCSSIDEMKGKDIKDNFILNGSRKTTFLQKFMKQDISTNPLSIKLNNGTTIDTQASIIFSQEESGIEVNGILFRK